VVARFLAGMKDDTLTVSVVEGLLVIESENNDVSERPRQDEQQKDPRFAESTSQPHEMQAQAHRADVNDHDYKNNDNEDADNHEDNRDGNHISNHVSDHDGDHHHHHHHLHHGEPNLNPVEHAHHAHTHLPHVPHPAHHHASFPSDGHHHQVAEDGAGDGCPYHHDAGAVHMEGTGAAVEHSAPILDHDANMAPGADAEVVIKINPGGSEIKTSDTGIAKGQFIDPTKVGDSVEDTVAATGGILPTSPSVSSLIPPVPKLQSTKLVSKKGAGTNSGSGSGITRQGRNQLKYSLVSTFGRSVVVARTRIVDFILAVLTAFRNARYMVIRVLKDIFQGIM
jgi:hypothetical protein